MLANTERDELYILSFNCKNIKTSGPFLYEMSKAYEVILIQEHWLFDFELQLLNEIHENINGIGKAVDSDNNFEFSNLRRGYGGVAILWSQKIDKYIKPLNDGGTRIQCIEISIKNPILLISVYLPTRVENDRFEEFSDCLNQLYEIIQKFEITHEIIIGGDFYEDISKNNNSRRANKMKTIMKECNLQTNFKGPTFINTQGIDVSEIDYFFFNKFDRTS